MPTVNRQGWWIMSESTPSPESKVNAGDLAPDASAAGTAGNSAEIKAGDAAAADEMPDHAAIDELLKQANFDNPDPDATAAHLADIQMPDAENLKLPTFEETGREQQSSSIDLLRDVELNVKIELGRSRMLVEDVLKLGEGSVVELDKLAGDPVDVFVNDRLVARGEVLVLNDNFCVRVNEIVAGVKEEGM
jgi:flagellar motor switch protein FliN/FliY